MVDVMTSSINLDADWSVVSQLPDAVNMLIVQYVNMNGRQSNINELMFDHTWLSFNAELALG